MRARRAEHPFQASLVSGSADASQLVCLLSECVQRPVEQIHPSMRLGPDLGLDSLGLMDLVMAIETELDVSVDESQVFEDVTLEQLVLLINQPGGPTREPYRWEWPLNRIIWLARDAAHAILLFPAVKLWVPLAAKLGVPVVPVSVSGTKELMPDRRLIPRRGPVDIRFGEALRFSPEVSYAEAARAIENAVNTLGQGDSMNPETPSDVLPEEAGRE